MNAKKGINSLLFIITIFLASCGGGQKDSSSASGQSLADKAEQDQKEREAEAQTASRGQQLYTQNCGSCHQGNGNGVPNMYPPLSGTKYVTGDKAELIKIILGGLSGEIEVKGKTYNNQMPAQDYLSDEEISHILTYVRTNFGNSASEITPEDVAEVRAQMNK